MKSKPPQYNVLSIGFHNTFYTQKQRQLCGFLAKDGMILLLIVPDEK